MIKDSNKALADFENAPKQTVALDRMRYTKNKLSGNLALLAIVCNVLYFVSVYKTDVGVYFYEFFIGASVLYNLVFMLTAFLSSESVKNYKINFAIVMIVLGALQVLRVFYIPLNALTTVVEAADGVKSTVISQGKFIFMTVCLCLSAVCLIVGGIIGIIRTKNLQKHLISINNQG